MEEQASYHGCRTMLEYFSPVWGPVQPAASHPNAHIHSIPHMDMSLLLLKRTKDY